MLRFYHFLHTVQYVRSIVRVRTVRMLPVLSYVYIYGLVNTTVLRTCVRRPNRFTHAWACGIAADDDMWENVLVDRRPVRLFLSSSDGLGPEESDHINVLTWEAVSKPH